MFYNWIQCLKKSSIKEVDYIYFILRYVHAANSIDQLREMILQW